MQISASLLEEICELLCAKVSPNTDIEGFSLVFEQSNLQYCISLGIKENKAMFFCSGSVQCPTYYIFFVCHEIMLIPTPTIGNYRLDFLERTRQSLLPRVTLEGNEYGILKVSCSAE